MTVNRLSRTSSAADASRMACSKNVIFVWPGMVSYASYKSKAEQLLDGCGAERHDSI